MDNDVERRGKPTNHVVFGETTALLSGDALLTYAFKVAANNQHVLNYTAVSAVKLLADNAGFDGMIGGQMLDLEGEKRPLERDEHLLMNRLKTGCLIRTACLLGCLAAGFGEESEEYAAMKTYSENIGLAFQIEDDLLDMGSEDNKTTFLTFMTVDEAKAKINELTDIAVGAIAGYKDSDVLVEFAKYLSSRTV
jgi:geranylgeranyl pyrophosphate synthase